MSPSSRPYLIFSWVIILAGGLFLRVWGGWKYLPGMDEMQFMIISAADSWGEVWRRAQAEIHPPLAWFIRHSLMLITTDFFPQRLLSAVAGMAAIAGMYRLGKILSGVGLGLFCAAMLAFSPSAVTISLTVRNYAFLVPFIIWALVFFCRWQQREHTKDLAGYCIFLFLACATHFSGFLVAIACGLVEGLRLLQLKRWRTLGLMAALHIPLLILSVVLYHYYLVPGATLSQWKQFMIATGSPPPAPQNIPTVLLYVLAYFFPFLAMASNKDFANSSWGEAFQLFSFGCGLIILLFYVAGLLRMRKEGLPVYKLILVMWGVALAASMSGLYPFSATRHNYYFFPFFILPFAYLCTPLARTILAYRMGPLMAIALVAASIAVEEMTLWYEPDFSITWAEFNSGQDYLETHLSSGDAIVTEWLGAYYYLLYAKDTGKTPYDRYTDIPYFNHTTILAPYGPPIRPYSDWHSFHDTLMKRLEEGKISPHSQIWFVDYGWRNLDIWTLMECKQAAPLMDNFFSRENVLIFSINAKSLTNFLEEDAVWKDCYKGYAPLVVGYPFHAVDQPR